MTYPVFASGDVLNAADMNGVGLWLVKTQAVGTGVSSVTVTGAFSADYENYRIIYSGGVQSASADVGVQLGSTTTNYYGSIIYSNFAGATALAAGDNNTNRFRFVGGGDTSFSMIVFDLLNPFDTKVTTIASTGNYGAGNFGTYNGRHAANTSFTAFTLIPGSGTFTGGTIRVYGYRN
jgi:hypothetical protein